MKKILITSLFLIIFNLCFSDSLKPFKIVVYDGNTFIGDTIGYKDNKIYLKNNQDLFIINVMYVDKIFNNDKVLDYDTIFSSDMSNIIFNDNLTIYNLDTDFFATKFKAKVGRTEKLSWNNELKLLHEAGEYLQISSQMTYLGLLSITLGGVLLEEQSATGYFLITVGAVTMLLSPYNVGKAGTKIKNYVHVKNYRIKNTDNKED